jgi:hypothetical protein
MFEFEFVSVTKKKKKKVVTKGVIIKRVYIIKTKVYQNFPQKKIVPYTYCSIDIYLNVLTIFALFSHDTQWVPTEYPPCILRIYIYIYIYMIFCCST